VYIFDCLAWAGNWLIGEPFSQRWQRCSSLGNQSDICLAETREHHFQTHFDELKQLWVQAGQGMDLCEGIVLKNKNGKLILDLNDSIDSRSMFKLKYRDIRDTRF
jgi:ATP-dependent DNA ligase